MHRRRGPQGVAVGGHVVLDDALAEGDGVTHQLSAAHQSELALDTLAMGLDGLDAEVQARGDLARGGAEADEAQYLQLAVAENVDARRARRIAVGDLTQHLGGHLVRDMDGAARQAHQRAQQGLGSHPLHEVAVDAAPQQPARVQQLILHREHEYPKLRVMSSQLAQDLEAVLRATVDVDDRQVRVGALRDAARLVPTTRLPANLETRITPQDFPQPAPKDRAVIDEQHATGAPPTARYSRHARRVLGGVTGEQTRQFAGGAMPGITAGSAGKSCTPRGTRDRFAAITHLAALARCARTALSPRYSAIRLSAPFPYLPRAMSKSTRPLAPLATAAAGAGRDLA